MLLFFDMENCFEPISVHKIGRQVSGINFKKDVKG